MKSLAENPRYRNFVNDSNRALERLLNNAQKDVSRILYEGLERALEIVARSYSAIPEGGHFTAYGANALQLIEQRISKEFDTVALRITTRWLTLRRNAFLLAGSAEVEAIGRALGQPIKTMITTDAIDAHAQKKTPGGENLHSRVVLSINRLKRDIMDAVELARVKEETLSDALVRVKDAFPKSKAYRRPKRNLKPLSEAEGDRPRVNTFTSTETDDQEWQDMLEHYKRTELPATRFDNEAIEDAILDDPSFRQYAAEIGKEDVDVWYSWEVEKEMTHDFVDKVRSGQNVEAEKAGIKDFVWVSILDERTDECCSWRNGLTVTEIEAQLKARGEEDEGATPPVHFNCRCALAPIGDAPERVESDFGPFSDWIQEP